MSATAQAGYMTTEPAPCCDAHYSPGYGTHQFSIVQRTRGGVKFFEAMWLPTSCRSPRLATKREATAWVKAHEKRCYGR